MVEVGLKIFLKGSLAHREFCVSRVWERAKPQEVLCRQPNLIQALVAAYIKKNMKIRKLCSPNGKCIKIWECLRKRRVYQAI